MLSELLYTIFWKIQRGRSLTVLCFSQGEEQREAGFHMHPRGAFRRTNRLAKQCSQCLRLSWLMQRSYMRELQKFRGKCVLFKKKLCITFKTCLHHQKFDFLTYISVNFWSTPVYIDSLVSTFFFIMWCELRCILRHKKSLFFPISSPEKLFRVWVNLSSPLKYTGILFLKYVVL